MNTCSTGPTGPTGALDPTLSVTPCYLFCISDHGVLWEEGGGGEDEGSRAICRGKIVQQHGRYASQPACLMNLLACWDDGDEPCLLV